MIKYTQIWEEIKQSLEEDLEEVVFTEIFEPVNTVFKVVNNYIYIVAPNEFIKKRIEMLYLNKLNRYLEFKIDEKHKFRVMTEEQASSELSDQKDYSINVADNSLTIGQKLIIPGAKKAIYSSYKPTTYTGFEAIKNIVKAPSAKPVVGKRLNFDPIAMGKKRFG